MSAADDNERGLLRYQANQDQVLAWLTRVSHQKLVLGEALVHIDPAGHSPEHYHAATWHHRRALVE